MQKYYYNDGASRFGPFTIDELQAKNITAETPVWYEGLPNWVKAGELDELKNILAAAAPVANTVAETVKAEEAVTARVTETTPASATVTETKPAPSVSKETKEVKTGKKSTAWVSWVIALMVFGGVGYFVYQDMEKNKKNGSSGNSASLAADSTSLHQYVEESAENNNPGSGDNTATTADANPATQTQDNTKLAPPPAAAVPPKNNAKQPANTKPPATTAKAQQADAQKLAQQKAEEEKRQLAALAKEKDYRNNWAKYITVGRLDYKLKDDDGGIEPFNVPVNNNTSALLEKVTLRLDYWKKDKKVVHSETVTLYNVPAGSALNAKAEGFRKGHSVKAIVTGITSRRLHFCYPGSSFAPDDPFYCN